MLDMNNTVSLLDCQTVPQRSNSQKDAFLIKTLLTTKPSQRGAVFFFFLYSHTKVLIDQKNRKRGAYFTGFFPSDFGEKKLDSKNSYSF